MRRWAERLLPVYILLALASLPTLLILEAEGVLAERWVFVAPAPLFVGLVAAHITHLIWYPDVPFPEE